MRLLVTGASGFIGAAVVRRAIEAGHEVVAAVRPDSDRWRIPPLWAPNHPLGFDLAEGPSQTLKQVLSHCDAVIHCAWENGRRARSDPQAQLRSFTGTTALFEAAQRAGVKRFVAIGSQAEGRPNAYARAKSATRDVLLLANSPGLVWAKLYSVFGPGERKGDSLLPRLVRSGLAMEQGMKEGISLLPLKLESDGAHFWHYLYEDDAADALIKLAEEGTAPASGIVNLYGYPPAKLRDLLNTVRMHHFPGLPIIYGMRRDPDLPCAPPWMPPKVQFADGVKRLVEAMRADARKEEE